MKTSIIDQPATANADKLCMDAHAAALDDAIDCAGVLFKLLEDRP